MAAANAYIRGLESANKEFFRDAFMIRRTVQQHPIWAYRAVSDWNEQRVGNVQPYLEAVYNQTERGMLCRMMGLSWRDAHFSQHRRAIAYGALEDGLAIAIDAAIRWPDHRFVVLKELEPPEYRHAENVNTYRAKIEEWHRQIADNDVIVQAVRKKIPGATWDIPRIPYIEALLS